MVSPLSQPAPYQSAHKTGYSANSPMTPIDPQIAFNSNPQTPPFSSVVQVPIRQILEEKKQRESAEAKHRKEIFTLIGPALLLLGGLSWMLRGLPKGVGKKLFTPFIKSANREAIIDNALYKTGLTAIGAGGAFLGANGILAGTTSQQPSMIIGNILQFIPSAVLMLLTFGTKKFNGAKVDVIRNLAISATMATGALFTVGLANEIRNKDAKTPDSQKRAYDMTRFKALTSSKYEMPLGKRIGGIFAELGKMTGFTVVDHARLLKNIPGDVKDIGKIIRTHPSEHPADKTLKDWLTKPSADKSDLAALFFYLGALPVLLFSHKMPRLTNTRLFKTAAAKLPSSVSQARLFQWATRPVAKIADGKAVQTLKWIGMVMANLSLFSIAMNRSDFRGKAPLLGVPMAVFGMASGKPFYQGMGNAGESINNLLYSDIAINGLETNNTSPAANDALTPPSPFQIPGQIETPTNPFQSSGLTKRYQIS